MSFEPRKYQLDAIRAVIEGYRQGKRQMLLRLPTGAGKTVISAMLIAELRSMIGQRSILFLAHRREIIDQTAEKIAQQIGHEHVTIEQAERKAERQKSVVVASIQTLHGRLGDYAAADFGVVIVDECHHAYAKTWMNILDHFGTCADTLILGLTATPRRSDGLCATTLFKETAFEISLGELQEQGFLVPMDYYTVEASLGLDAISRDTSGDFQVSLLGKIMNSPELRQLTVRAFLEKASKRKTIAFCASVEHAKDLASDLEQLGIRSAFISGECANRDSIIDAFRQGRIQFLSNFGVLIEGFDDPSIECVLLARPTTSPLVYSQCIGRGLRSYPGKKSCIIIDIIDRQRQQLQYNAFEAAGLKRSWRGSGRDPLREAEAIARIRVTDPEAFLKIRNALSLQETHAILMGLDPNLVLAGIDGAPLMRYSKPEVGHQLDSEEALDLVARMLKDAKLDLRSSAITDGSIQLQISCESENKTTPYLSWHIEEATGYQVRIEFCEPAPEPLEDATFTLLDETPQRDVEEKNPDHHAPRIQAPPPLLSEHKIEPSPVQANIGLKARLNQIFDTPKQNSRLDRPSVSAVDQKVDGQGSGEDKSDKNEGKARSMIERLRAIHKEHSV